MKAKIFFIFSCLIFGVVFSQSNIASVEYFFDTDPGVGNGAVVAISPDVENLNQTLSIPTTGLSEGTHRLFVRAINIDGTTSMYVHKTFRVGHELTNNISDIVEAEYFINQDPGVGMGTAIDVLDGGIVDETLNIATSSLPVGTHRLFIRTKNAVNEYSLYEHKTFRVAHTPDNNNSDIVEAEYFFNQDPGVGMGTAIDVIDGSVVDENLVVPTIGLPAGTHRIFVRTKNAANQYSLYEHKTFRLGHVFDNNTSDITAAEYFIDADPGIGSATALTVSGNSIDENFNVNIPVGLAQGDHYLYVRTKNMSGEWSLYERQYFEVNGVLGIEDQTLEIDMKMYPNPVSEYLTVNVAKENKINNIRIYDLNGKLVLQETSGNINMSYLNKGIYLVVLDTKKGKLSKRVLKQ